MEIRLTRPLEVNNHRLYYRKNFIVTRGVVHGHFHGPLLIPSSDGGKRAGYRVFSPDNILSNLRLYRWFSREYENALKRNENLPAKDHVYNGYIPKETLLRECFPDSPRTNPVTVGKLLRMVVQYDLHYNFRPHSRTEYKPCWRWVHPLDIVFGLEHLMATWVPRVTVANHGKCENQEDFLEELEVLKNQTNEEDRKYVEWIVHNKMY